jgi:hypothetical protein
VAYSQYVAELCVIAVKPFGFMWNWTGGSCESAQGRPCPFLLIPESLPSLLTLLLTASVV